jgi:hypothetical protein
MWHTGAGAIVDVWPWDAPAVDLVAALSRCRDTCLSTATLVRGAWGRNHRAGWARTHLAWYGEINGVIKMSPFQGICPGNSSVWVSPEACLATVTRTNR